MARGKRVIEVIDRATKEVVYFLNVSMSSDSEISRMWDELAAKYDHSKFELSVTTSPFFKSS